jgi:hypothetical protein
LFVTDLNFRNANHTFFIQ